MSAIIEDSFRRSDFFSGITELNATDILIRGNRTRLKSGEFLFRQGDPAVKCFFVLSGHLKLIKLHEQGKETIIRYIGPGELTAIISVFKGKDYPVTAESIGPTEAVGWDKQAMEQLVLKYPPLAVNMLRCTIILSTCEKKGWIKSKREQITVCDPHSLVVFSEGA